MCLVSTHFLITITFKKKSAVFDQQTDNILNLLVYGTCSNLRLFFNTFISDAVFNKISRFVCQHAKHKQGKKHEPISEMEHLMSLNSF